MNSLPKIYKYYIYNWKNRVLYDMMENEGIEDNIFVIETTYFMLYEFLIQLRKEYNMVK